MNVLAYYYNSYSCYWYPTTRTQLDKIITTDKRIYVIDENLSNIIKGMLLCTQRDTSKFTFKSTYAYTPVDFFKILFIIKEHDGQTYPYMDTDIFRKYLIDILSGSNAVS